jgi:hypothetical protein
MNRILSIVKGRCPNCETGAVFARKGSLLKLQMPVMKEDCPRCSHHFEKEPGFFLGAMYVSYALTLAESVTVYLSIHYFITEPSVLLLIIAAVVGPMALINYRSSRILWMYAFTQRGDSGSALE